eukprot:gnl/TRDRNA2_/TRDRNA2_136097_c0_seq1.p1 gnl/TRDRNA2_/TRDRNA2_136097_c0~~gnl/TRDRNA2_/TRDRNA2_136097_c0_seq1.p1  ORF type:complete len:313 (+),score=33.79 gnl/TRDRNA2_/TRDRNA2_136097_c0_seq1:87-941(+)
MANEKVRNCEAAPVMVFCLADCVFSVLHVLFAFYLQNRLVQAFRRDDMQVQATPAQLMSQAGHIVLYDIGFCLYLFAFVGSFGFNCLGLKWTSDCPGTSMPYIAGFLLILYAIGAVNFAFMWWCMLSCDDCCGLQSTSRPAVAQGAPPRLSPAQRVIFGKQDPFMAAAGAAVGAALGGGGQQRPSAGPAPVYQAGGGVPMATATPYATATPVAGYAGGPAYAPGYAPGGPAPGYATPAASAPPPQSQQPSTTAKVAGGALSLAGAGLQAAGNYLGSGKKQQGGR